MVSDQVNLEQLHAYRALLENSRDSIAELDLDGRILFTNWSSPDPDAASVHSASSFDYILPEHHDTFRSALIAARETGEVQEYEVCADLSSHRTWWLSRIVPVRHGDTIARLLWVATDITRRREAEERMRASQRSLATTLDSIADGVIATDTNGIIKRMNPVAETLTGWPSAEGVGCPIETVFHLVGEFSDESVEHSVSRVLREGQAMRVSRRARLLSRDGREYIIAGRGAPIRDDNDVVTGVVLIFEDLTEQIALERHLQQSQKMEALGQLAGGVAHDFNNLIGTIAGFASLLVDELDDGSPGNEFAHKILKIADSAASTTRQLLSFSRRSTAERLPLSMHARINAVVDMITHTMDRRIAIVSELEAERDTIMGDEAELQQVLLNLAINASDAMPTGGKLVFRTRGRHVSEAECERYGLAEAGEHLQVMVSDSGEGMPAAMLPRIFDPFFTTKAKGKGTGMGLACCYSVIQGHKGHIGAASSPGHGTVFSILLPLTEAPVPSPVDAALATAHEPCRILLIDDEVDLLDVTALRLRRFGHTVWVASDGVAGVEMYRKHHAEIDLVLVDINMPVLSGWECFRQLRSVDPEVVCVMCSGYAVPEEMVQHVTMGSRGLLTKPLDMNELRCIVNDVVAQKSVQ